LKAAREHMTPQHLPDLGVDQMWRVQVTHVLEQ
jgi:hypothetical protein